MKIHQVEEVVTKALTESDFQEQLLADFEHTVSDYKLDEVELNALRRFTLRLLERVGGVSRFSPDEIKLYMIEGWF